MEDAKPPPSKWIHFIAGGVGGAIGAVIFNPLDVIKTRLQSTSYKTNVSQNLLVHKHIWDTFVITKAMVRVEGFSSLFKGLGPNLAGIIPARSIHFLSYGNCKAFLTDLNCGKETSAIHLSSAAFACTYHHLYLGIAFVTSTITNPIWMIKTRLQLNKTTLTSLQLIRTLLQEEGPRSLFRGLSASYLGGAEVIIHWIVYEKLKSLNNVSIGDDRRNKKNSVSDLFRFFGFAGVSKFGASLICYPHEVVRTRMRQTHTHNEYSTLYRSIKCIFKNEGVGAFYAGLTPHLIRTVPNAMILFGTYELVLDHFR